MFPFEQGWPNATAQVVWVALHSPLWQAALVFVAEQLPCSPSAGSASPALSSGVQVKVSRWQKLPLLQSSSTQQASGWSGTQTPPLGEHCCDWQNAASSEVVHAPAPLARQPTEVPPETTGSVAAWLRT